MRKKRDHLGHVDDVLQLLKQAGGSLKLKNCKWFQPQADYLGHVVTPGKLAIASEGTKSIRGATFPEDIIQLRSFLGAFNVYGKYANWFSRVVRPLNNMLTKDAEPDCLNPSKEELEAFEALKETLVTPPVLARQKKDRPYMVDTDPSKYAIGAVLVQQQDENYPKDWVLIGHWSKTFTQPEENY